MNLIIKLINAFYLVISTLLITIIALPVMVILQLFAIPIYFFKKSRSYWQWVLRQHTRFRLIRMKISGLKEIKTKELFNIFIFRSFMDILFINLIDHDKKIIIYPESSIPRYFYLNFLLTKSRFLTLKGEDQASIQNIINKIEKAERLSGKKIKIYCHLKSLIFDPMKKRCNPFLPTYLLKKPQAFRILFIKGVNPTTPFRSFLFPWKIQRLKLITITSAKYTASSDLPKSRLRLEKLIWDMVTAAEIDRYITDL